MRASAPTSTPSLQPPSSQSSRSPNKTAASCATSANPRPRSNCGGRIRVKRRRKEPHDEQRRHKTLERRDPERHRQLGRSRQPGSRTDRSGRSPRGDHLRRRILGLPAPPGRAEGTPPPPSARSARTADQRTPLELSFVRPPEPSKG